MLNVSEEQVRRMVDEAVSAARNRRAIDRDELLKVAEELEADYWDCAGKHRLDTISVDKALTFERGMAARIRKAVGE